MCVLIVEVCSRRFRRWSGLAGGGCGGGNLGERETRWERSSGVALVSSRRMKLPAAGSLVSESDIDTCRDILV